MASSSSAPAVLREFAFTIHPHKASAVAWRVENFANRSDHAKAFDKRVVIDGAVKVGAEPLVVMT